MIACRRRARPARGAWCRAARRRATVCRAPRRQASASTRSCRRCCWSNVMLPLRRPPSRIDAPSTSRMLPTTEPMIEARATSISPSRTVEHHDDQLGEVAEGGVEQRREPRPGGGSRLLGGLAQHVGERHHADGGGHEDDRAGRAGLPQDERNDGSCGGDAERDQVGPGEPRRLACSGRHVKDSILPEVMRILLTNDDGVGSPLLAALATTLDAHRRRRRDRAGERHDRRLARAQPARPDRRRRDASCRTAARRSPSAARRPTACASLRSAWRATRPTSSSRAQPRPQPGRRRGLLRHGRGGARGRVAGPPGGRRSRSRPRTTAARTTSPSSGRFAAAARAAARLRCAAARRRHQRQRACGRGRRRARRAARTPSSTGRSCGRPARPRAAGATTGSTAPGRCGSRASRARTSPRSPTAASRSRRCASISSPTTRWPPLDRPAAGGRMSYTTAIFDLDGTLIDTVPLIVASHRHALATVLGRELPEEVLRDGIGRPLLEQMRVFDEERAQELFDVYRELQPPRPRRLRDARSTACSSCATTCARAASPSPSSRRRCSTPSLLAYRRHPGPRGAHRRAGDDRVDGHAQARSRADPARARAARPLRRRARSTSATPPATCSRHAPPAWPRSASPGARSATAASPPSAPMRSPRRRPSSLPSSPPMAERRHRIPPSARPGCARELSRHLRLYHELDEPEISDAEYDALYRELRRARGAASPSCARRTRRRSASARARRRGSRRPSTCSRCSRSPTRATTRRWPPGTRARAACSRSAGSTTTSPTSPSPRSTGSRSRCVYRDGVLTRGATRGDGADRRGRHRQPAHHRGAAAAPGRRRRRRRSSRCAARSTCRWRPSSGSTRSASRPG